MLFSSITFLYYFLPAVLVIYYLAPAKVKNLILFLASFVFYLWGEPKYSVLLLFSVAVGYMGGRCMSVLLILQTDRENTRVDMTGLWSGFLRQ